MVDKDQRPTNTNAPSITGPYSRFNAESGDADDLRRKKRNKCLLYIVLFAIFQTGIILIFALIVMKVRTPKLRLRSATLNDLSVGTPTNPLLRAAFAAELTLRNANFGRYKYQNTTVEILYGGQTEARAVIRGSRVGWRSTKKLAMGVDLNLGASAELARDLSAGVVRLAVQAKVRGRVDLVFLMRKKRSTGMNCSMEIVVATQLIQNIVCK